MHVPLTMRAVELKIFASRILREPSFRAVLDFFSQKPLLHLLYRGSENRFSSLKFHELCDYKGPTLSIARTEHQ